LENQQTETIHCVARQEKFQLMPRVPAEFHVTLAYMYKAPSEQAMRQMTDEVTRIFQSTIGSYGKPILFSEPRLSSFEDMTDFRPWNAEKYPF
jgi:hypothetical protein